MPLESFSTGSSVTRLCCSGRSSQIAEKADAMVHELAIDPVMVFAPGQPPRLRTDDRFEDRPDAAAELKGIAAHEIAPRIGLVEFLSPETARRAVIAVERLIDIAVGQGVGVKHQVLADQPAGIG